VLTKVDFTEFYLVGNFEQAGASDTSVAIGTSSVSNLVYYIGDPSLSYTIPPFTVSLYTPSMFYVLTLSDTSPLPPFIVFDSLTLQVFISSSDPSIIGSYSLLLTGSLYSGISAQV